MKMTIVDMTPPPSFQEIRPARQPRPAPSICRSFLSGRENRILAHALVSCRAARLTMALAAQQKLGYHDEPLGYGYLERLLETRRAVIVVRKHNHDLVLPGCQFVETKFWRSRRDDRSVVNSIVKMSLAFRRPLVGQGRIDQFYAGHLYFYRRGLLQRILSRIDKRGGHGAGLPKQVARRLTALADRRPSTRGHRKHRDYAERDHQRAQRHDQRSRPQNPSR